MKRHMNKFSLIVLSLLIMTACSTRCGRKNAPRDPDEIVRLIDSLTDANSKIASYPNESGAVYDALSKKYTNWIRTIVNDNRNLFPRLEDIWVKCDRNDFYIYTKFIDADNGERLSVEYCPASLMFQELRRSPKLSHEYMVYREVFKVVFPQYLISELDDFKNAIANDPVFSGQQNLVDEYRENTLLIESLRQELARDNGQPR